MITEDLQGQGDIIEHAAIEQQLVILGLGKLGGQEMGYKSDLDLVIISSMDAVTDGMAVRNAADQEDLTPEVPSAEGREGSARHLESWGSPTAIVADPTATRASELQGV